MEENEDRGVPNAVFQVCQMTLGYFGCLGQRLPRHAVARAQASDPLAERGQETAPLFGRLWRSPPLLVSRPTPATLSSGSTSEVECGAYAGGAACSDLSRVRRGQYIA